MIIAAASLLALVSGCSQNASDLANKTPPTIVDSSENYQTVYRRLSKQFDCIDGAWAGAFASYQVDRQLYTELGFGEIAMSQRVHALLMECVGKEASINGATQVRAGAIRPEIIVGQSSEFTVQEQTNKEIQVQGLDIGSNIRIIRVPYFGLRAEVVELPATPDTIETGATTRVLRAKLEDGRVVTVPRANVEL